jgi:shikimate kinase
MGSGKTTIGTRLAKRLGRPFVDNDEALQRRTGRTAREISMEDGLDALHAAEVDTLLRALADPQPSVVGAAAAAAVEPEIAAALEGAYVVYLRAEPAVLQARVAAGTPDNHRPDLDLTKLDATRDPIYRARASLIVDAEEPVAAVVDAISGALG